MNTIMIAAELNSSEASQTMPRTSKSPPSDLMEIRNLPDNITLTEEILKNNVCRICATYYKSGPRLVPLYLNDEGKKPLAKLINAFLPIKVEEDDGMPQNACSMCTDKLNAWSEMWKDCAQVHKLLVSQAEILERRPFLNINEKSHLGDTVQSVLASYLLNTDSMQLVCHLCECSTSAEEFHRHLRARHARVRGARALGAFVRDHVTFEDVLDSSSDGDASDAPRALCGAAGDTRARLLRHLSEGGVGGEPSRCETYCRIVANGSSPASPVAPRFPDETNQKRIPAVCPECNRIFSNKYNMLKHMKRHGAAPRETFDCECGRSYSTRGNLTAHRRLAHLRLRPARPQRPPRPARLAPRRYRCELCGAGFRRPAHLRYHVGTHRPRGPT